MEPDTREGKENRGWTCEGPLKRAYIIKVKYSEQRAYVEAQWFNGRMPDSRSREHRHETPTHWRRSWRLVVALSRQNKIIVLVFPIYRDLFIITKLFSISNAWIRFTVFSTNADVGLSHPYSMRESTRVPDSLYLVVDPMLLLQTLHSLSIAAVATLLRTSTVEVPSFYNVAYKYSEFGNVGNNVVSAVHHDLGLFCADFHAVRTATCTQTVRYVLQFECASLCRLQVGVWRRVCHQLKW